MSLEGFDKGINLLGNRDNSLLKRSRKIYSSSNSWLEVYQEHIHAVIWLPYGSSATYSDEHLWELDPF